MKDMENFDFENCGYALIPMLSFLIGKPYDDSAKAFITTLRPSSVVINWMKMDWSNWRVEVDLDEDNNIIGIRQLCEVYLPDNIEDGHELMGMI